MYIKTLIYNPWAKIFSYAFIILSSYFRVWDMLWIISLVSWFWAHSGVSRIFYIKLLKNALNQWYAFRYRAKWFFTRPVNELFKTKCCTYTQNLCFTDHIYSFLFLFLLVTPQISPILLYLFWLSCQQHSCFFVDFKINFELLFWPVNTLL